VDYQYDPASAPAYGYQPDPYQQQPQAEPELQPQYSADPYAAQQGYYQEQPVYDPGYGYQQQPGYDQQQIQQQPQQGYPQQSAALDETSFFDTGMIDLDRLRELEQGR
jgi:hypothetical protein